MNLPPRSTRRLAVLITLVCLVAFVSVLPPTGAQRREVVKGTAKRVLVVSLDGLDARYLRDADRYGLKIPTLRRLMRDGAWAREGVVGVYPSVTYPSHTTIVTGAHPARHGIASNSVFEPPPAPRTGAWLWHAREIRVETLWDAAQRARLTTAMISWPVSTGAGDWNVPEIWKVGTNPSTDLRLTLTEIKKHERPAGLVEEMEGRDPSLYQNVTRDEGDDMRTRWAEYVLAEKKPHATLVHLFDLDHYQHDYGPFTPEAFRILEKVDGYVARMLAASERVGTLDETAVFIVSDHGFRPVTRQIHPGVILARAGLLTVGERPDANRRSVVTAWNALHHNSSGSSAIYLASDGGRARVSETRAALKRFAEQDGRTIYRVLEANEVRKLNSNPNAAFVLEAADGYHFGDNLTGEVVTESKTLGTHGFLPTLPLYRASLIASGAGVTRRTSLGQVRMIDIGPTIARALGLTLRDAEGRPLTLR